MMRRSQLMSQAVRSTIPGSLLGSGLKLKSTVLARAVGGTTASYYCVGAPRPGPAPQTLVLSLTPRVPHAR